VVPLLKDSQSHIEYLARDGRPPPVDQPLQQREINVRMNLGEGDVRPLDRQHLV
jgi:hypothetical protein